MTKRSKAELERFIKTFGDKEVWKVDHALNNLLTTIIQIERYDIFDNVVKEIDEIKQKFLL